MNREIHLSLRSAGKLAGVSKTTVRDRIKKGLIKGVYNNAKGHYFVPLMEIIKAFNLDINHPKIAKLINPKSQKTEVSQKSVSTLNSSNAAKRIAWHKSNIGLSQFLWLVDSFSSSDSSSEKYAIFSHLMDTCRSLSKTLERLSEEDSVDFMKLFDVPELWPRSLSSAGKVSVSVRLPMEVSDKVKYMADEYSITKQELIEIAINNLLGESGQPGTFQSAA